MGLCCGSGLDGEAREAIARYRAEARAHRRERAAQSDAGDQIEQILSSHCKRPPGYPLVTEVEPSLFLGSMYDALDVALVGKLSVTHTVNATRARLPANGVDRLDVPIEDDPGEDIYKHFSRVCSFTNAALCAGGRVLVHCEQGVSRSATLVAAFLVQSASIPAKEAMVRLKERRPMVCPNLGFLQALLEWEAQVLSQSEKSRLQDLRRICFPDAQYARLEQLPGTEEKRVGCPSCPCAAGIPFVAARCTRRGGLTG